MNVMQIKTALVSLSDKSNLKLLVEFFIKNNIKVLSTGGTAKYLKKLDSRIKLEEISIYTNSNEILNGRVKTLHPKIHAGILCDKNVDQHMKELKSIKAMPIDLVVVNLYPFEKVTSGENNSEKKCIESIDIGGPTMLRAAAKNFKNVITLCDPKHYESFIENYNKSNGLSLKLRKELACKVFELTSYYEGLISNWYNRENPNFCFSRTSIPIKKISDLRYGENPHQKGGYYKFGKHKYTKISGKELSFNNVYDLDSAIELANEFSENSCVILKHGNPCGVALDKNQKNAYKKALSCDETSAFGGIVAFNNKVSEETAKFISKIFTEVVIAPDFTEKARLILSKKKNLILVKYLQSKERSKFSIKSTQNFILIQDKDNKVVKKKDLVIMTKKSPSNKSINDLLFAFTVSKYLNSNAIVLASNLTTLGIGVGQTSRIDSTKQAIAKIKGKKKTKKIVLASDGFFPFPDIIKICSLNNIKAVIQPGGSINDEKVIDQANKLSISVVFTNIRHFRH